MKTSFSTRLEKAARKGLATDLFREQKEEAKRRYDAYLRDWNVASSIVDDLTDVLGSLELRVKVEERPSYVGSLDGDFPSFFWKLEGKNVVETNVVDFLLPKLTSSGWSFEKVSKQRLVSERVINGMYVSIYIESDSRLETAIFCIEEMYRKR